jgi:hypothetical protein
MQHLKERHDTLQVVWLNIERDSVREREREKDKQWEIEKQREREPL